MIKRIVNQTPLIGSAIILGFLFSMTTLNWPHALLLVIVFALFNAFIAYGTHQRSFLRNFVRIIAYIAFAFMTIAYFVANYFTSEGITFDVLTHLNSHSFSAAFYSFENYQKAGLLLIVLFIVIFFSTKQHRTTRWAGKQKLIYSVCLILMLALHPFAITSANLIYRLTNSNSSELVLQTIDDNYYSDQQIRQAKQAISALPNVLLIYLESLERTYFDSRYYENLMTELEDLSKQALDFTDVRMTWGATHTIAGMIASLCGVPINSPAGGLEQSGNSDVYMPKAQCLGDITKKLGYYNIFYQGAYLSFTNKGGFLRSHGFDEVNGRKELYDPGSNESHYGPWGLHDDKLLQKVEGRLDELMETGTQDPFFFTMLTLDTHDAFGENRVSNWCIENNFTNYPDADHKIQHAVYCSEKLLARFIKRVKEKWGDELVIIMMNDHAAYPFNVGKRLKEADKQNHRRLLFSIFDGDRKPETMSRRFSSLDLGATVLGYITGNKLNRIGLGTSALDPRPNLIEQQGEAKLNAMLQTSNLSIGKKLWQMPSFKHRAIEINLSSKTMVIDENVYSIPTALVLDKHSKIIDFYGKEAAKNIALLKVSPRVVWVDQCINMNGLVGNSNNEDEICLLAGNLGNQNYYSSSIKESTTLHYQDYATFLEKKTDPGLLNDRLYKQLLSQNNDTLIEYLPADSIGKYAIVDIHSTMSVKASLFHYTTLPTMAQRLTLKGLKRNKFGYPSGNGFYLFDIKDGIVNQIYHWKTCINKKDYLTVDEVIAQHKHSRSFILVSARQVKCESDNIKQYFDNSPFQSAGSVLSIQPYVGYWNRKAKKAFEIKGPIKSNVKLRLINDELLNKKMG